MIGYACSVIVEKCEPLPDPAVSFSNIPFDPCNIKGKFYASFCINLADLVANYPSIKWILTPSTRIE